MRKMHRIISEESMFFQKSKVFAIKLTNVSYFVVIVLITLLFSANKHVPQLFLVNMVKL